MSIIILVELEKTREIKNLTKLQKNLFVVGKSRASPTTSRRCARGGSAGCA